MKAKDYIIIGGALALLLLWKNKNKKVGTATTTGATTTGGATITGGANTSTKGSMLTNGGMQFGDGYVGGTTYSTTGTAGTSQVTVLDTPPPSSEPEQVFGLGLPTGMDLPNLTAGTGIPTEVAVQQGGVSTTPEPSFVNPPPLGIEESLNLGGIKPIVKNDIKPTPIFSEPKPTSIFASTDPIVVVPREKPTLYFSDVM